MATIRFAAFLLPFLAALLAPALLEARPGWRAAAIGHGVLLLAVLVIGLAAGASVGTIAAVLLFSTAFAALGAAAHRAAGQVASGLLVVALGSTIFLAGPIVRDALDRGGDASARLETLLAVNPYAVLDASVFGRDVLREPVMYRQNHVADYLQTARYPSWGRTAVGYLLAAALLAAVGEWRRRRSPA